MRDVGKASISRCIRMLLPNLKARIKVYFGKIYQNMHSLETPCSKKIDHSSERGLGFLSTLALTGESYKKLSN